MQELNGLLPRDGEGSQLAARMIVLCKVAASETKTKKKKAVLSNQDSRTLNCVFLLSFSHAFC